MVGLQWVAEKANTMLPLIRHPDVHSPWKKWAEDQTLHLAVVYANPFRWETRRRLFNNFLDHIAGCPNITLYVGEVAYGDRPYEVTESGNSLHVQCRTNSVLWGKENLVDVVTACFPEGWKYGGYSDGDFAYTRKDFGLEAVQLLQLHQMVQLYSSYTTLSHHHRPTRLCSSFAWNYLHRRELYKGHGQCKGHGKGHGKGNHQWCSGYPSALGAPGGGWAYRSSAYDAVGGMIDKCILGSADLYMAKGLIQQFDAARELRAGYTPAYVRMIEQWQQQAKVLTKNIGCVNQHAIHHFHGSYKLRGYGDRWHILRNHQFDPDLDVSYDRNGILRLNGNKPDLRDDIRAYFSSRCEDNLQLDGKTEMI